MPVSRFENLTNIDCFQSDGSTPVFSDYENKVANIRTVCFAVSLR